MNHSPRERCELEEAMDEKETRKLKCDVSEEEVEVRKNRLVKVDRQIDDECTQKREEISARNKVLRELRDEQKNLVSAIETGKEEREVDCFWRMNDRLHKKELVRADTGQVVDEAPQTLGDKQEDLFDAGKGKKPSESDSGIVEDDYGNRLKKVRGKGKKSKPEQAGA
jgi:hypothetical protein